LLNGTSPNSIENPPLVSQTLTMDDFLFIAIEFQLQNLLPTRYEELNLNRNRNRRYRYP